MALPGTTSVLLVGAQTFDWADVKHAAAIWGDWQRAEAQARAGLACVEVLEAAGQSLEEDELEAAAEEFRDERNLLAADEMSAWLEARGLTVEEWLAYIERSVARARCAAGDGPAPDPAVDDATVDEITECEAILSGALGETLRRLAAAAVWSAERGEPAADVARLCDAFAKLSASVVDEPAVSSAVAARQMEWTAFHCRLAAFADEDQALEAAHCIREEGLDLAEVAAAAGSSVEDVTIFFEELDAESQARLLSAEKGAVAGPMLLGERQSLVIVLEKKPPSAPDPLVRRRAETFLVDAAIERLIRERARIILEI